MGGSTHRTGALCTREHPSEHGRPSGGRQAPSLEKWHSHAVEVYAALKTMSQVPVRWNPINTLVGKTLNCKEYMLEQHLTQSMQNSVNTSSKPAHVVKKFMRLKNIEHEIWGGGGVPWMGGAFGRCSQELQLNVQLSC